MNVQTIRNNFKRLYLINKYKPTIEIIGASFIADEPTIFSEPNQDYINAELDWYMSKSDNIYDIKYQPTPKIWKEVASKDGRINSNYGKLIFDASLYYPSQYDYVLSELVANPNSRRATMIYTYPEIHDEYKKDGMNDFICTNTVSYYIRKNVLDCVVQMRSNDAIYGYKNDYAWQKKVLDMLSDDLGIEPGTIKWQVQNLHIYERHYRYLET